MDTRSFISQRWILVVGFSNSIISLRFERRKSRCEVANMVVIKSPLSAFVARPYIDLYLIGFNSSFCVNRVQFPLSAIVARPYLNRVQLLSFNRVQITLSVLCTRIRFECYRC